MLKANQCKQVVMPEVPDRVLISCGVVVLHCIPRRDGSETRCVHTVCEGWIYYYYYYYYKSLLKIASQQTCGFTRLRKIRLQ